MGGEETVLFQLNVQLYVIPLSVVDINLPSANLTEAILTSLPFPDTGIITMNMDCIIPHRFEWLEVGWNLKSAQLQSRNIFWNHRSILASCLWNFYFFIRKRFKFFESYETKIWGWGWGRLSFLKRIKTAKALLKQTIEGREIRNCNNLVFLLLKSYLVQSRKLQKNWVITYVIGCYSDKDIMKDISRNYLIFKII